MINTTNLNRAQQRVEQVRRNADNRPTRLTSDLPAGVLAALKAADEHWERAHPSRLGTRQEVAAHETGHLIGYEAEGLGAAEAEIHFVRQGATDGWAGTASMRLGLTDLVINSSDDFLAAAVVTFCGPAGGAMFANVDPFNHSTEIMNVAVLAAQFCEAEDMDFGYGLAEVTKRTARILHFHRNDFLTIADRLARRRYVSHREPKIERVLKRIQAGPSYAVPSAPEQELELARQITRAPIDLAAFAVGVARLMRGGNR